MENTVPFVAAAFFCERVLHEKDNVLSVVRIVDTYYVDADAKTPPNVVPVVPLTALVMVKSGSVRGESQITARIRFPSGHFVDSPAKWPILLNGGEHGANLVLAIPISTRELGVYWLDIFWNDTPLTSAPVRLAQAQQNARAADTQS